VQTDSVKLELQLGITPKADLQVMLLSMRADYTAKVKDIDTRLAAYNASIVSQSAAPASVTKAKAQSTVPDSAAKAEPASVPPAAPPAASGPPAAPPAADEGSPVLDSWGDVAEACAAGTAAPSLPKVLWSASTAVSAANSSSLDQPSSSTAPSGGNKRAQSAVGPYLPGVLPKKKKNLISFIVYVTVSRATLTCTWLDIPNY
jgi:hypothetical protein